MVIDKGCQNQSNFNLYTFSLYTACAIGQGIVDDLLAAALLAIYCPCDPLPQDQRRYAPPRTDEAINRRVDSHQSLHPD